VKKILIFLLCMMMAALPAQAAGRLTLSDITVSAEGTHNLESALFFSFGEKNGEWQAEAGVLTEEGTLFPLKMLLKEDFFGIGMDGMDHPLAVPLDEESQFALEVIEKLLAAAEPCLDRESTYAMRINLYRALVNSIPLTADGEGEIVLDGNRTSAWRGAQTLTFEEITNLLAVLYRSIDTSFTGPIDEVVSLAEMDVPSVPEMLMNLPEPPDFSADATGLLGENGEDFDIQIACKMGGEKFFSLGILHLGGVIELNVSVLLDEEHTFLLTRRFWKDNSGIGESGTMQIVPAQKRTQAEFIDAILSSSFSEQEEASVGIIGGADGPTQIVVSGPILENGMCEWNFFQKHADKAGRQAFDLQATLTLENENVFEGSLTGTCEKNGDWQAQFTGSIPAENLAVSLNLSCDFSDRLYISAPQGEWVFYDDSEGYEEWENQLPGVVLMEVIKLICDEGLSSLLYEFTGQPIFVPYEPVIGGETGGAENTMNLLDAQQFSISSPSEQEEEGMQDIFNVQQFGISAPAEHETESTPNIFNVQQMPIGGRD